jgi:DNA-binding IclR family transcriptional regulator
MKDTGENFPKPFSTDKGGTQCILRTIHLIQSVAENERSGIRLSKLARKVALPVTTVHRILSVLVSEGFIDFNASSKSYCAGIALHSLGQKAYRFALCDRFRSCLESIARATKESIYLVMRSGLDSLCVDLIEGRTPIRIMAYGIGSRHALGIGAASLALLAFSEKVEIDRILKANARRYAINNQVSLEKIQHLIEQALTLGYVFSEGQYLKGVNAVGVPIFGDKGVEAAISVASVADRMNLGKSKEIARIIRSEIALVESDFQAKRS